MSAGIATAVLLGGGAHVGAGGAWSGPAIALGALLLTGPTWLLTSRERGWLTISALLFGGQLVVHFSFAAAGHGSTVPSPMMVAYHLVAAVLLGWWLRRGERVLWQAARRVAATVDAVLRRLLDHRPRAVALSAPVPATFTTPHLAVLRHAITLRAPPAAG